MTATGAQAAPSVFGYFGPTLTISPRARRLGRPARRAELVLARAGVASPSTSNAAVLTPGIDRRVDKLPFCERRCAYSHRHAVLAWSACDVARRYGPGTAAHE